MEFYEKKNFEYIKIENGRWTLNGKLFNEMSLNERFMLAEKILGLA